MSTLFITAYGGLARGYGGQSVQAPLGPQLGHYTVTFTTAAVGRSQLPTESGTLPQTATGTTPVRFIEVQADAIAHFTMGTVSTISGTTSQMRIAVDQSKFIGVDQGGLWISAIGGA